MLDIRIKQEDLLKALKLARIAVNKREKTPMIKLESINPGRVQLTNTDYNNTVLVDIDAEINGYGTIILPIIKFGEIIEKLNGYIKMIEDENSGVHIKNNNTNFWIKTIMPEQFIEPTINFAPDKKPCILDTKQLLESIKRVGHAVQQGDNMSVLNGINFNFLEDNNIELCATDGNRLATMSLEYNQEKQDTFTCIPKLLEFIKNISDEEISLITNYNRNEIVIKSNDVVLISKMIMGKFPAYKQLIPQQFKNTLVIEKNKILEALYKVIILLDERLKTIELKVINGDLLLYCSKEGNTAEDVVEVKENNCEDGFTIALNAYFLLECVRNNDSKEITLKFNDNNSAIMVSGDFDTIIMPINMRK